ncbi:BNR/Asp-box repeat protein [Mycena crocata]|nr:BNR/Asp-box repeat protein [Mycena crocata]
MRFSLFISAALTLVPAAGLCAVFSGVTVYTPPSTYKIPRVLYPRTIVLSQQSSAADNGVLLATWENYGPEPPYFPIYRSTDGGRTWSELSHVTDTVNGVGLRYQPFLFELPAAVGTFAKGTILCAGSSIPEDLSFTQIDLYASTDKGTTWKFVSHIARGGMAVPDNGLTPVWEPFLFYRNGQIVVYYSDQRDPAHGQKTVHQVTSNLLTWGPIVDDAAYATFTDRPGMPVLASFPNGQFILAYEWNGGGGGFRITYRLSNDPLNFANKTPFLIAATDGTTPTSSPYVVWTPAGGVNGTIVISANSHTDVFTNTALGAPGSTWRRVATPAPRGYARALAVMPNNTEILIVNAGTLGGSNNFVTAAVISV